MKNALREFLDSIPAGTEEVSVRQLMDALSKLPGDQRTRQGIEQRGLEWFLLVNLTRLAEN